MNFFVLFSLFFFVLFFTPLAALLVYAGFLGIFNFFEHYLPQRFPALSSLILYYLIIFCIVVAYPPLLQIPYYDPNWGVVFWEGRPFDFFDYPIVKAHVCPRFPHDSAFNAEIAHSYFSARVECYNIHIAERPIAGIGPTGKFSQADLDAINFNNERARDLADVKLLRDHWAWQVEQRARLDILYDKWTAEMKWSERTSYYGYWLALVTLILLVLFVILLGI